MPPAGEGAGGGASGTDGLADWQNKMFDDELHDVFDCEQAIDSTPSAPLMPGSIGSSSPPQQARHPPVRGFPVSAGAGGSAGGYAPQDPHLESMMRARLQQEFEAEWLRRKQELREMVKREVEERYQRIIKQLPEVYERQNRRVESLKRLYRERRKVEDKLRAAIEERDARIKQLEDEKKAPFADLKRIAQEAEELRARCEAAVRVRDELLREFQAADEARYHAIEDQMMVRYEAVRDALEQKGLLTGEEWSRVNEAIKSRLKEKAAEQEAEKERVDAAKRQADELLRRKADLEFEEQQDAENEAGWTEPSVRKVYFTNREGKRVEAQPRSLGLSLRAKPFQRGTFRVAYMARLGVSRMTQPYKGRNECTEVALEQYEAKRIAKAFQVELRKTTPPLQHTVTYVDLVDVELHDGRRLFLERFMPTFKKFNNNEGKVFPEEASGLVDPVPQALSHFSLHLTEHQFVLLDIQGSRAIAGGQASWTEGAVCDYSLTDPAFHSLGGDMGDSDLGAQGIESFCRSHTCNAVCRAIGLPQL